MTLLDKYGYPVETIKGRPIANALRRLLWTRKIVRGWWDGYRVVTREVLVAERGALEGEAASLKFENAKLLIPAREGEAVNSRLNLRRSGLEQRLAALEARLLRWRNAAKWERGARKWREADCEARDIRIAALEAERNTWKEIAESEQASARNLAMYAEDDTKYRLPMAHWTVRDAIKRLREQRAALEAENRALREFSQALKDYDKLWNEKEDLKTRFARVEGALQAAWTVIANWGNDGVSYADPDYRTALKLRKAALTPEAPRGGGTVGL